MKEHVVLSAVGRDRIGVVDDLAAALTNRRLDIEESRWAVLKGQFALIVEASGEATDIATLKRDLPAFGRTLGVHVEMGSVEVTRPPGLDPELTIESFSTGPAGVGAVTGLLKHHGVNIEELKTEASAEPWTSRLTFHLRARVTVPPSSSIPKLTEELRELGREHDLDLLIEPKPEKVTR